VTDTAHPSSFAERARSGPSDVIVVGAGPAGCATAITLARAGFEVVVFEQRSIPRPRTCAGLVSPAALNQLEALGLGQPTLSRFHRIESIDLIVDHRHHNVAWPQHPDLADHALVAPRETLDASLVDVARACGATVLERHEAIAPLVERGLVTGAQVRTPDGELHEFDARYTVIADGANSRFGRSLGTHRDRSWPMATAVHSAWRSPFADRAAVEVSLNLFHDDGHRLTGYGWVVPTGGPTVDIGVAVVSTSAGFRSLNTTHLLADFARSVAMHWHIDPESCERPPMSGRVPIGGSVGPIAGPTTLVVGDAAGAANPLSGLGIDTALMSGTIAGEVLVEALEADDPAALQRFWRLMSDRTATLYKVGRLLDRINGRPRVFDRLAASLVRSDRLAETAVRLATQSLRASHGGAPEQIYRAMRAVSRLAPDA